MIIADAGPLIAIIDRGEPDHARCVEASSALTAPMITTWPALTEAMSLLGSAGGWTAQDALWRLIARTDLQLVELDSALQKRTQALIPGHSNGSSGCIVSHRGRGAKHKTRIYAGQ